MMADSHEIPPECGDAGFTLAELLVALALLVVVLGFASGGLRLGVRIWEATRAIDADAEVSAARDAIASCLKSAMPLSETDPQGRIALAFEGHRDQLALVCPTGDGQRIHQPILTWLDLRLVRSGTATHLIAATRPFIRRRRPDEDAPAAEAHRLVSNIEGLAISYFGDTGDGHGAVNRDSWEHPNRLPELVTVTVRFDQADRRRWPSLAVAVGASER